MTLSNEDKRQIMDKLAQGKPGFIHQEPQSNQSQEEFDSKKYENFDDFAQRSGQDNVEVTNNDNLVEQIRRQIKAELQQAKDTGQLRTERIREIVKNSVSQVGTEIKAGSNDVRQIAKDAVVAVSESLQEKGSEIKEEITATIEGVIEGFSSWRRQSINKSQAEVKQLQATIETEEEKLQQEVERLLHEVEEAGKDTSPKLKATIESAINTFRNSEEFALLKKRYAQLQTQAAIVKANLAARYGGRYEEIKEHLEEANSWYKRTRNQAGTAVDSSEQKRSPLEERIGEAGEAITGKELQIRKILSDLLQAAADLLREKETSKKENGEK